MSEQKAADDPDEPIWGASCIAPIIKRTERATFHLLESGQLDAVKVGGRWVTTRRRLLARIAGKGGNGHAPK